MDSVSQLVYCYTEKDLPEIVWWSLWKKNNNKKREEGKSSLNA